MKGGTTGMSTGSEIKITVEKLPIPILRDDAESNAYRASRHVNVRVPATATIADLKQAISEQEGWPVEQQRISYNDQEKAIDGTENAGTQKNCNDQDRLHLLGIKNGSTVQVNPSLLPPPPQVTQPQVKRPPAVAEPPVQITLFIKTLSDEETCIQIMSNASIKQLKAAYQAAGGPAVERQVLIYGKVKGDKKQERGQVLADDSLLTDYDIADGTDDLAVIRVVERSRPLVRNTASSTVSATTTNPNTTAAISSTTTASSTTSTTATITSTATTTTTPLRPPILADDEPPLLAQPQPQPKAPAKPLSRVACLLVGTGVGATVGALASTAIALYIGYLTCGTVDELIMVFVIPISGGALLGFFTGSALYREPTRQSREPTQQSYQRTVLEI